MPPPVGGILLGYLTSYLFAEELGGWRSIYAVAAPLALVLGLGMVGARALLPAASLAGEAFLMAALPIVRELVDRTQLPPPPPS